MFRLTKPSAAVAAVAIAGLAFAGGSYTAADAGGITKGTIKSIAKKQADKEIAKKAPTLSVGHSSTSDFSTTAGSANTAAKIGTSSLKTFQTVINPDAPGVVLGALNGLTLTGTCPSGVPIINASANGGKIRWQFLSGSGTPGQGGTSSLSTVGFTVNDASNGLGNGYLDYTPNNGTGVSAFYAWRDDSAQCTFFGSLIGG